MASFLTSLAFSILAVDGGQYKEPPAPIPAILDAAPAPTVRLSPDQKWLLVMDRPALPPISEVGAPELRLAGTRINPRTYSGSRDPFLTGLRLIAVTPHAPAAPKGRKTPATKPVSAAQPVGIQIPGGARVLSAFFSPDSKSVAMILSTETGLSLAVADVTNGASRKLTEANLSGVLGAPCAWSGNSALVCLVRTGDKAPEKSVIPTGPAIQESRGGSASANPTYQDMLQDPGDEALFEHYATSRPVRVTLDGRSAPVGPWGLYRRATPSPDGRFLLVQRISRPFSYVVPWFRFPTSTEVWNADGTLVKRLAETPLQDAVSIASDSVAVGPRAIEWRGDSPSALVWAEALDQGNPAKPAAKRDALLSLAEPFMGDPQKLADLDYRYRDADFGADGSAIVTEGWSKTKRVRTWRLRAGAAPELLFDRSSEDRYAAPGSFLTAQGAHGAVLQTSADGKALYLSGNGASPEGDRPFLDRYDLATKKTTRLFHSTAPRYEDPIALVDARTMLVRRESVTEPPNYFLVDVTTKAETRLTDFKDPAPQLGELKPELLKYKRADGVELTANLYLPPGYKKEQGPIPFLLWAYPQEFASAAAASQVSGSPYRFQRPTGASHLFLLTLGYGILDDPKMPIVGENGSEPNDTYITQLVASAEAAVKAIVDRGVADPKRIAVGGHSYGAFMTANLLAHSRLFAAGLARSGAYNRTLTPFGFQAEDRNFWQAQKTYMDMSPFVYADKIKDPILLIHGAADTNTGTFPIQSDRFFAALKGHGATTKLVFLPAEAHGYRARESVGHTLYEMANWLDTYVKNRK